MADTTDGKTLVQLKAFEKKLDEQILSLVVVNENLQENNQQVLAQCNNLQDLPKGIQKQIKHSLDQPCKDFTKAAEKLESVCQDNITTNNLIKELKTEVSNIKQVVASLPRDLEPVSKKLSIKRSMLMAGFIATLMTGAAIHHLFISYFSPQLITEKQRSDINYGRLFKIVWPNLSKKEQARIIKLLEIHNSKSGK